MIADALAARAAAVPAQEIRRDAGFIEKDEMRRVPRRRCFNRSTQARLTSYFSATATEVIPASLSRKTRSRRSIE
jgi:hypothetical protein